MYTSATIFIASFILFSESVTVYRQSQTNDIVTATRTEIKSFEINCYISDIIIISVPIIDSNHTLYYLRKPNGDDLKLNLGQPHIMTKKYRHGNKYINGDVKVKFLGNKYKVISPINKFDTFNVNYGVKQTDIEDVLQEKLKIIKNNDFMIGPVGYGDHGNWMLSIYYKDKNVWAEVYQVITVYIIETVPADPSKITLKPGEDFELRFAYPIKGLKSCELKAPSASADKVYDRSWLVPDTCGYVVKNVTAQECGVWGIAGVGKVVYTATSLLTVQEEV